MTREGDTVVTTAEYLRSIVAPLIPGVTVAITEQRAGRLVILSLDVPEGAARGIVLGKGGETIKSLRRLLTVFAGLHNESAQLYFNTEKKESKNDYQQQATR